MALMEVVRPSEPQAAAQDLCDTLARRAKSGSLGTCPVELSDAFVGLCAAQSCGKCVPCRVGLAQMKNLLESILDGKASEKDLSTLEKTARNAYLSADCAIGYEAGAMVIRSLKGFKSDFVSHTEPDDTPMRCVLFARTIPSRLHVGLSASIPANSDAAAVLLMTQSTYVRSNALLSTTRLRCSQSHPTGNQAMFPLLSTMNRPENVLRSLVAVLRVSPQHTILRSWGIRL